EAAALCSQMTGSLPLLREHSRPRRWMLGRCWSTVAWRSSTGTAFRMGEPVGRGPAPGFPLPLGRERRPQPLGVFALPLPVGGIGAVARPPVGVQVIGGAVRLDEAVALD